MQWSEMMQKTKMVSAVEALPGRDKLMQVSEQHFVNNHKMLPPFPDNTQTIFLGLGCFWGAEKRFWNLPGVYSTAVGYSAGFTPNPTYEEVCTGLTGHNEVVQVVFFPEQVGLDQLFEVFWESHDPTQGMRQGNDIGTQYRSGIYYVNDEQKTAALLSMQRYQAILDEKQLGNITTEIQSASRFYYAEDYHQQYLAKNPGGYCGLGGLGVSYCR